MLFKDIHGHTEIKMRLIETVKKQRISHAQLFAGPEGNGKLALALAYAQFLNCENPSENDACGNCKSCKKYEKLVHPDLHFVFPVVTTPKNSKPVSADFLDKWREYLINSKFVSYEQWLDFLGSENKQGSIFAHESKEILKIVNLKTFEAKYKVIIIFMPEKMNITAANKLLKAIEEPPPKTLFLLVSEDSSSILNTILSRTQLVKIPKLSDVDIKFYLKENFPEAGEDLINDTAKISNGNIVYAKQILSETLNPSEGGLTKNFDYFATLMRLAYSMQIKKIMNLVDELAALGREKQKNFILYSLRMIRENFIMNFDKNNKLNYQTKKELEFSQNFHKFINKKNITLIFNEFNKAYNDITRNATAKILFLDLILKTAKFLKMK